MFELEPGDCGDKVPGNFRDFEERLPLRSESRAGNHPYNRGAEDFLNMVAKGGNHPAKRDYTENIERSKGYPTQLGFNTEDEDYV